MTRIILSLKSCDRILRVVLANHHAEKRLVLARTRGLEWNECRTSQSLKYVQGTGFTLLCVCYRLVVFCRDKGVNRYD